MNLLNHKPVFALAGLTFKEAVRSRIFIIIFVIGLVAVILSSTVESITIVDKVKLMRQWIVLIISGTSIICTLFIVAFGIPFEIESKRIQMLFSKPLTRGGFFIGKALGYGFVIFSIFLILGVFGYLAILFSVSGSDDDRDLTSINIFAKPLSLDFYGATLRKDSTGLQGIPAIYTIDDHKNTVEVVFDVSEIYPDYADLKSVTLDLDTMISMRRNRELQDKDWIVKAKHPERLYPEFEQRVKFHDPSKYEISMPGAIFDKNGISVITLEFEEFPYNLGFSRESIRLLIDKTTLGYSIIKTLIVQLSKVWYILVFVLFFSAFFSAYTSIIGGFTIWFLTESVYKIPQTIAYVQKQMLFEVKRAEATGIQMSWVTKFSSGLFDLGINKILVGLSYVVPDFNRFNILWNFVEGYDTSLLSVTSAFLYFVAWIIGIVFIGYVLFSFRDFE